MAPLVYSSVPLNIHSLAVAERNSSRRSMARIMDSGSRFIVAPQSSKNLIRLPSISKWLYQWSAPASSSIKHQLVDLVACCMFHRCLWPTHWLEGVLARAVATSFPHAGQASLRGSWSRSQYLHFADSRLCSLAFPRQWCGCACFDFCNGWTSSASVIAGSCLAAASLALHTTTALSSVRSQICSSLRRVVSSLIPTTIRSRIIDSLTVPKLHARAKRRISPRNTSKRSLLSCVRLLKR